MEPDDGGPDRFEFIGGLILVGICLAWFVVFGNKYRGPESHDCVSGRVSARPSITVTEARPGGPSGIDGVGGPSADARYGCARPSP